MYVCQLDIENFWGIKKASLNLTPHVVLWGPPGVDAGRGARDHPIVLGGGKTLPLGTEVAPSMFVEATEAVE